MHVWKHDDTSVFSLLQQCVVVPSNGNKAVTNLDKGNFIPIWTSNFKNKSWFWFKNTNCAKSDLILQLEYIG